MVFQGFSPARRWATYFFRPRNRQVYQRLPGAAIANDHDPRALSITAARSEARIVENGVENLVWQWVIRELTHC
jgi:hypothetical protein